MAKQVTTAPSKPNKKDLPTPDASETAAIDAAIKRVAARAPRVTVKFTQNEDKKVDLEGGGHNNHEGWLARLVDVFGTRGTNFAQSQLNLLMAASRDSEGKIDSTRLNAMLAMIEAARPENELQAALAVQMTITHFATLTVMSRALRVEQIPQFDSAGNMAVKLARTFALQAETLAKLQRGGEQIVKVVHVHSGGQAIVGNVNASPSGANGTRGGVADENGNQPHAKAITAADAAPVLPPLRCQDEEREPVPVPRGEG